MSSRLTIAWVAAFALGPGLVGCGEEEAPAPSRLSKAAAPGKAAGTAQTAVAGESPSKFAYSPVGKRDPFQSYLAELREQQVLQGDDSRKREATEEYELDQYRLTLLITGTAQPKAMVEDPNNVGHVVRIGSRLGKRGGIVTRISSAELVVTEEISRPTGERIRVPITVKMPQPELNMQAEP